MLKTQTFLTRRLTLTVGAGFALSLLLMAALTVIGLRELASTDARMKRIVQENSVKSRLANQMRDTLRGRSASMLSIVVMNDPFDKDKEMQHFYELGSRYQKTRIELDPMLIHPSERAIIKEIDNLTRQNQPLMVRTIDLGMDGYTFLAFEVLQNEGLPMQRALIEQIDKLIDLQREATRKASQEAAVAYEQTRWLMLILGMSAAAIAALVALLVLRRTSRLAAETERERTKFQTLFETNTDGIVILNKDVFTECNPATLEIFGIDSADQFLSMRPEDMGTPIQPDGSSAVQLASRMIREAMETGHATFAWQGRRSDGSTFPAEIALHAMELDGHTSLQAIIHDTTQQMKAEATLKAAHAAALAAADMKSQFVANVSHEIRTPMNGIIGMTHLLQGTRLNERQREYADAISNSAEALLHIINDLLDFSKIEAGRLSIEEIVFDLPALLADVIELYKPRASNKKLDLILQKNEGIPVWVRGDPFRIRQILLNLLDNAIKFTPRGSVRLTVARLPGPAGNTKTAKWRFSVEDSGVGIPAHALSHIFDAFSQADGSTSRQFGGTGLGLTICQQLAHLMGGNLSVQSEEKTGSTFFLDLPLEASSTAPETPNHPIAEAPRFEGARILVAEDNPTNQKLLQFMLEGIGIEVLTANNGKIAFDLICADAQNRAADLVLMDCQMPEWDGLTATRAIRQWETDNPCKRMPILALTANAMSGFAETCTAVGMDDYLTKPLLEEELVAALQQWLPETLARSSAHTASTPTIMDNDDTAPELADLLDLPRLRKLCRNDAGQVVEMLQLFVNSSEQSISALTEALQNDDTAQCARQAHQLKGATAYLGATELQSLANLVETTAKSENHEELANQIEDLEAAFIQLRLHIENTFPD